MRQSIQCRGSIHTHGLSRLCLDLGVLDLVENFKDTIILLHLFFGNLIFENRKISNSTYTPRIFDIKSSSYISVINKI